VRSSNSALGFPSAGSSAENGDEHAGNSARRRHPKLQQLPTSTDFTTIYEAWFDVVAQWVRAMGGPAADHQDLAQDVFVVVHQQLHRFDGQNLPGWLYQIARHRVRDFRRLRWIRLFAARAPLSESLPCAALGPEAEALGQERRQILARLLSKLPGSMRDTLVLFEIEGFSGEEIAEIQSIPINTVWGRIHKARKRLSAYSGRLAKAERRLTS
jgi:RNA polymerase sigma factor (sigma-70 family)